MKYITFHKLLLLLLLRLLNRLKYGWEDNIAMALAEVKREDLAGLDSYG
jgi:hypothetical protein